MHHIELGPWNHAVDLEMFELLKYNTFYLSFWFLYLHGTIFVSSSVLSKSGSFFSSEADFLIWSIYISDQNLRHIKSLNNKIIRNIVLTTTKTGIIFSSSYVNFSKKFYRKNIEEVNDSVKFLVGI